MNDKLKDAADQFHDKDLHIPTKTMLLEGDVDEDMYKKATKNLHILDQIDNNKPITIKMNSSGGEVIQGLAIYDLIKTCKNYVRIIVEGPCESMATVILQAADERVMLQNSHLMLHFGSHEYPSDHPMNIERWKAKVDHDEKVCQDIYLKKIKEKKKRFTKKDLQNLLTFDTILTSKEAITLGLADIVKEI
jgi:ATP-dependent protease ClpP protease subunit